MESLNNNKPQITQKDYAECLKRKKNMTQFDALLVLEGSQVKLPCNTVW